MTDSEAERQLENVNKIPNRSYLRDYNNLVVMFWEQTNVIKNNLNTS